MNDLQIEYFLAVASNLSFTKTAAEKYVSQPAISKQIAAMEEELGVALFERSYKSVKLTEAGKLFADFYKKQQQDLDLLARRAKDVHKRKKILLRIGCGSGWIMTNFMPNIIARMTKSNPEMVFVLESHNFNQLPMALAEGEVDLIISLNFGLYAMPSLEIHSLTEVPRVVIYSEHHPLANCENLRPQVFKDEVFFIPVQDEAVHIVELVRSICEPYGFTPRIRGVKNVESLILSVLNGLGVAITDDWTIQSGWQGLRHIPLNTNHAISIAWRRNNDNPALAVFLREIALEFYPNGGCSFENAINSKNA